MVIEKNILITKIFTLIQFDLLWKREYIKSIVMKEMYIIDYQKI